MSTLNPWIKSICSGLDNVISIRSLPASDQIGLGSAAMISIETQEYVTDGSCSDCIW